MVIGGYFLLTLRLYFLIGSDWSVCGRYIPLLKGIRSEREMGSSLSGIFRMCC
ncbi:hypothetical protein SynROS8604_02208 [Synechococcus sp. ROS8604]|nr:hypothetical protein SynROS8604_02208 [Synechococcus sp. ROS8604]